MKFPRLQGLTTVSVCVLCSAVVFVSSATAQKAQTPPAQTPPAQTPQTPPPAKPNPQNPFETVPTEKEPAPGQPQQPKLEAPRRLPRKLRPRRLQVRQRTSLKTSSFVDRAAFRRIRCAQSSSAVKATSSTRRRCAAILWRSGIPAASTIFVLNASRERPGWIIRFILTERRVVRSIKYEGNKSITVSEILDRFKERKVGLSVESQYDPNKVQHAVNVLKEYEAERGRQFATVAPDIRQVPPSSLEDHVQSGRRAEGEGRRDRRSG